MAELVQNEIWPRTGPDPDSTGSSAAGSGPDPDSGRDQQLRAARVLEGRVWSTVMPMRHAHLQCRIL
jgi:hypothetical protein